MEGQSKGRGNSPRRGCLRGVELRSCLACRHLVLVLITHLSQPFLTRGPAPFTAHLLPTRPQDPIPVLCTAPSGKVRFFSVLYSKSEVSKVSMKVGGHIASRSYISGLFFVAGVKHLAKSNFGKERLILVCSLCTACPSSWGKARQDCVGQQAGHMALKLREEERSSAGAQLPCSLSSPGLSCGMVAPIFRACVFPLQPVQPRNFLTAMLRSWLPG